MLWLRSGLLPLSETRCTVRYLGRAEELVGERELELTRCTADQAGVIE